MGIIDGDPQGWEMFLLLGLNSLFSFPASKMQAAALCSPSPSSLPQFVLVPVFGTQLEASVNCAATPSSGRTRVSPLPDPGQSPALCFRIVSRQPRLWPRHSARHFSDTDSANTHANPGSQYYSSHFTEEETDALRSCLSSPRSHSRGRSH